MRATPPDYGMDAPGALRGALVAGATATGVGALARRGRSPLARVLRAGLWVGPVLLAYSAAHWWGSRVGKRRLARRLLGDISWRGDEQVLDVGCGRGLLLVETAHHTPAGRVVGIDMWQEKDQADNRPDATLANAALEKVDERVHVLTADAGSLPFPTGHFDLVVSSFVLHNLHARDHRRRAIQEISRVLRPGGSVLITDIFHVGQYGKDLSEAGLTVRHLETTALWLLPTRSIAATKPAAA